MRPLTSRLAGLAKTVFDLSVFNFGRRSRPGYDEQVGRRILISFLGVAVVGLVSLRYAFGQFDGLSPSLSKTLIVGVLCAIFFLVQRGFIHEPLSFVGLRPFRGWSREERLYTFLVIPVIACAMALAFRSHLGGLLALHGPMGFVVFSLLTGLAWGAVQELLFRGWLQTELVRRFGATVGLVAANLVFTLGPLHLDLFAGPDPVRWGVLAAVFGVGLLFGMAYLRTGNLWIPAVLHGLWPPNMT